MEDLGTPPDSDGGWAAGVSADGSVVVGAVEIAAGQLRTFRWTRATGVEVLDLLADPCGEVYGVSADGSVVVGTACISSSIIAASVPRAFRWTRAMGMEDLTLTYAHLLTDGSVLEEVRAISPSGRYIVGNGRNATTWRKEAFLLDTGVLQLGIIPIALPKFVKTSVIDDPLLKVPPARRGNRVGARLGSPREAGGTCRRGAIHEL